MHSKQNDPSNSCKSGTSSGSSSDLRSSSRSLTAAIVVLIVTGVVAGLIPRLRQQTELGAETLELSVPTVTVVSPKPGQSAAGLPLPAEIKPWVEAPIYARANGYLKRRLVDIGTHVEAGQLLAEIDTPELNQELERARAQLAQAEAALGLAKITAARWAGLLKTASVSEQENAEKQADLKLKTATAESARAEVRRLEKLQSFARVTAPFCRHHHGSQYRFGRSHRRRRRQGALPPGANAEASGLSCRSPRRWRAASLPASRPR